MVKLVALASREGFAAMKTPREDESRFVDGSQSRMSMATKHPVFDS